MNALLLAGETALRSLKMARDEIGKALGWGVVDILGGDLLVTIIKRAKVKKSRQYIEAAKLDLNAFADQLGRVDDFDLEMHWLVDIGDFMDWLWADVLVEAKLAKAKVQMDESIARLQTIVDRLRRTPLGV